METQTCNKCRKTKSLNEFHRRGDGHRKTCKTCINVSQRERYAKTGKTRITSPAIVNKNNIPVLSEMVSQIEPHLRAKASRYSSDPLEADDVYGAMVEAILTKSDPQDSIQRILTRADWAATEYLHKKRTYNFRVDEQDIDTENIGSAPSAEDEIVQSELSDELKAIISQLPPEHQKVVSMLSLGMSQREIAKKLAISEQAVSQKVKRIGSQMQVLGFSPA